MLASAVGAAMPAGTVAVSAAGTITPVTVMVSVWFAQFGVGVALSHNLYTMLYTPGGVVALVLIAPVAGSKAMPVPKPLTMEISEFAAVAAAPLTVSLARMLASAVGAAMPAGTVADSVTGFGGSIIVPIPVIPLIVNAVVSEVSTVLSTLVG